ncbi:MAG: hypothetical protein HYW49_01205 [Deltaproteobacteria bacterium]|nr:hypothetical protein [Deltaproteobacteria bacterium]
MSRKKPEAVFFDSNVYVNLLRSPEYERRIEHFLQGAYLYTVSKIVLMRRRLTWDILIALSAKEHHALLVTENESDFKKIQGYVDFEFVSPSEGGARS